MSADLIECLGFLVVPTSRDRHPGSRSGHLGLFVKRGIHRCRHAVMTGWLVCPALQKCRLGWPKCGSGGWIGRRPGAWDVMMQVGASCCTRVARTSVQWGRYLLAMMCMEKNIGRRQFSPL